MIKHFGGFQIFTSAKLRKIKEEGVHFQNHVNGTPAFISPEVAMEMQATLGSDIAMAPDECAPWPCEHDYAAKSLEMTIGGRKAVRQMFDARRSTLDAQRSTFNGRSTRLRDRAERVRDGSVPACNS